MDCKYYLNNPVEITRTIIFDNPDLKSEDISAAKMKYRDPDNIEGDWTATMTDTGEVKSQVQQSGFNKLGEWTVWPSVTISNQTYDGSPTVIKISKPGT